MDYTVHGVTKSWERLSDFHFLFTAYTSLVVQGEGGEDATGNDSQTSDWGCWKPKIQLIEKEFRRKSWSGVEVR